MIFGISKFIANLFGLDVSKVQRVVFWTLIILGLVLLLSLGLWVRSCGKKTVKLNEKEQQEVARAIEEKNDAKLKEKLIEIEVKEAEIDANVASAQAATWAAQQNAREKYANMNTSELAAELEKRK
jgi:uncharacterized membrane protein